MHKVCIRHVNFLYQVCIAIPLAEHKVCIKCARCRLCTLGAHSTQPVTGFLGWSVGRHIESDEHLHMLYYYLHQVCIKSADLVCIECVSIEISYKSISIRFLDKIPSQNLDLECMHTICTL